MNSLSEIAGVLKNSTRLALCGHVMPDGDCLGSVAALGMVLEEMGKTVALASPDPLPELYAFLPRARDFVIGEAVLAGHYDTFVALDCSVPERLGPVRKLLDRNINIINIDHHVGAGSFAGFNYVDPGAAATGEIVMDLLDAMGAGLSADVALCLYVALVTDTGSFQYENTSSGTLMKAARLMDSGVQAGKVNIRLFEEKPLKSIRVLEAALGSMELSDCGRVAWTSVQKETLERLSALDEHTDGLIGVLRGIRGVEVAVFFREISRGRYKVGLRSKGQVDVNLLAARFGGGGHTRASGCIMEGHLKDIKHMLVQAALAALEGEGGR